MARPDKAASTFRFSTDELDERSRAGAIGELCERRILPTKIHLVAGCTPRVHIVRRSLPGLGILSGALDGVRQEGTRDGDKSGAVFFAINLQGAVVARQRGREVDLHEGDGVLLTRDDTGWTLVRPGRTSFVGLMVPRALLEPMVPNIDDAVLRPISRETGALRLLTRYLAAIDDEDTLTDVGLLPAITSQIHDLVALSIGATTAAEHIARDRGVRAARLRAIKQDILAHLGDGDLRPAQVATRHGMTLRYMQKLFEGEGLSYSEFLLTQRLTRAYRLLTSPLHAQRAISDVAYDVGFNDLSYFNRTFRRQYRATPSDVRAHLTNRGSPPSEA
jgi:AraC-like DNA-binding protein